MNIQSLKQMVNENVNENISLLVEVLDLYEHENKAALQNIFANQKDLAHDVVVCVLTIYSLLCFIEDKKELAIAQESLGKLINAEPLVKDIIAIYLQLISIEDLNPNLSKERVEQQNKKLIQILTSY